MILPQDTYLWMLDIVVLVAIVSDAVSVIALVLQLGRKFRGARIVSWLGVLMSLAAMAVATFALLSEPDLPADAIRERFPIAANLLASLLSVAVLAPPSLLLGAVVLGLARRSERRLASRAAAQDAAPAVAG